MLQGSSQHAVHVHMHGEIDARQIQLAKQLVSTKACEPGVYLTPLAGKWIGLLISIRPLNWGGKRVLAIVGPIFRAHPGQ